MPVHGAGYKKIFFCVPSVFFLLKSAENSIPSEWLHVSERQINHEYKLCHEMMRCWRDVLLKEAFHHSITPIPLKILEDRTKDL